METWTGRRGTIGPRDAGRAFDAARDGGWGWSCVVDRRDDAAVRLTCAVNLTAEGLQVREAGEGLDALVRRAVNDRISSSHEPPDYGAKVVAHHVAIGRLTSVCMSPLFERVIGLAILDTATAKIGARVDVDTGAGGVPATVAPHPYHDTDKTRPRL